MEPDEAAPTSRLVGERIKAKREQRGLDLVHMSALLTGAGHPIHPDSLSRMEKGRRKVTVDDLVAVADVLSVDPAELLAPGRRRQESSELEFRAAWLAEENARLHASIERIGSVLSRAGIPASLALAAMKGTAEPPRSLDLEPFRGGDDG